MLSGDRLDHMLSSRLWIVLTICSLALISVVGLFYSRQILKKEGHPSFKNLPSTEQRKILRDIVERKGVESGWQILIDNAVPPVGDLSYFMGGELFKLYGIGAATRCPSRFAAGCHAAILASAIASGGVSSIPELLSICESWGSISFCAHGLGHGFAHLASFDRQKALAYCDLYIKNGDQRRCWAGVFQEYERSSPSDSLTETPWGQCESVPKKYQSMCSYAHTEKAWEVKLQLPFIEIAGLCLSTDNFSIRQGCIFALGRNIARHVPVESIGTQCQSILPKEEGEYCRIAAAEYRAWIRQYGWEESTISLCNELPEHTQTVCAAAIQHPDLLRDFETLWSRTFQE